MGAGQGAEETGVLAVPIMHLYDVVEGCVEEGELSKHNCSGDMVRRFQCGTAAAVLGARTGGRGAPGSVTPRRKLLVHGANCSLSLSTG